MFVRLFGLPRRRFFMGLFLISDRMRGPSSPCGLHRRRPSGYAGQAGYVSFAAWAAAPRVAEGEAWSGRLVLGRRRLGGVLISRRYSIGHLGAAIGDAVADNGGRQQRRRGVLRAMPLMRMPFRRVEDHE